MLGASIYKCQSSSLFVIIYKKPLCDSHDSRRAASHTSDEALLKLECDEEFRKTTCEYHSPRHVCLLVGERLGGREGDLLE